MLPYPEMMNMQMLRECNICIPGIFQHPKTRILRVTSTRIFQYSSNCIFQSSDNCHIPLSNMPASQHSRIPNIHVYPYSNTPTCELLYTVNIAIPTYLNIANIRNPNIRILRAFKHSMIAKIVI